MESHTVVKVMSVLFKMCFIIIFASWIAAESLVFGTILLILGLGFAMEGMI